MADIIKADLCIIGGGSGGLSVAAGAAQMGAKCVLVEKAKMGGDCLNTGCVPSKSLLAAAHTAHDARHGARFGIDAGEVKADFARVHDHVHGVIASIAPHDSVERFEELGVQVISAAAEFTGPRDLIAGEAHIQARRYVIATGSRAFVPPIPGLDSVAYFTNETIFDLTDCPRHLIVIGGGPIGLEMAQAHRRLGAEVTVIEGLTIMNKDDPELVEVVRSAMKNEGLALYEGAKVSSVEKADNGELRVSFEKTDGGIGEITGSHLLVAVGRAPNVQNLGLDAAGITHSPRGIEVDARLRTSNKRIFAIGDVAGGYQFTHVAGYHAGVVIRNALFRLPAKADHSAIPWVTYSAPELAHVGLSEADAKEQFGDSVQVLRAEFSENDRARAERATDGLLKAVVTKKGKVLGASIVGAHAGELILPWVFAVQGKLKVKDMASVIAPYPTLSEITKRAAGSFYTPSLFSDRTRRLVRFLGRFG
ncbi:MAG: FAD-dependent oxidoreductase [Rhodospirillales bacterium]|jgi:pyruvate/2-oxoglutarate dehydrogenase complex dihydrolipoamide dehydrogenase (E3) component|nr:FAD-dependent oxidoreductase [Rhodospirillales bacterium]MBT5113022.1 FAD-dependent oxidoreductase [Rhodospirillales bacterium]MBT5672898.1 FAD-dependent oxidoreductase [Rhodospirillales bacterium]MBT6187575.1 FAD-dependent oxidoreductase [Rhodospirillales bacterium]MBT6743513.1 FAD-dependent oxidoreductase [Rhodospirillales bacterium]